MEILKRNYAISLNILGNLVEKVGLYDVLIRSKCLYVQWFGSLFAIHHPDRMARLGLPWWNFKVIEHVETFLGNTKNPSVFEYGSGASSFWLARRAASVISVEYDTKWHSYISKKASAESLTNLTILLKEPIERNLQTYALSKKSGFEALDFEEFVEAISEHDLFDLIVIDGRARNSCFDKAIKHLKPNGIILFDDTHRKRYKNHLDQAEGITIESIRGLTPTLPYPNTSSIITCG